MGTVTLKVDLPEDLHRRFYKAVTEKKGKWRGSKQSVEKALQTAVEAALNCFMDSLEEPDLASRMTEALKR